MALLAAEGSDDISLRAVARAAGVSAMAPYRHFPDKAALLAAVAARGFAALRTALQAADDTAEPGGALVAQAVAYVDFAVGNPALFRLMFGPAREGDRLAPRNVGGTAFSVLAGRVAAESAPDERDALTLGCWALVHGLASLVLDGQLAEHAPSPPADLARRVASAMLAFRPPRPGTAH